MEVLLVPAFADNYIYVLRDPSSGKVGVVDPGDAAAVRAALGERGWPLTHIFATHHHDDHIGGTAALKAATGAAVTGARADAHRIDGLDTLVGDGDAVEFGSLTAQVIAVPGHTTGHIAYWFPQAGALFCGDALFALGCGRMFEGTAAQMWSSLTRLRALPDDTMVHCGHEYTLSNARFAVTVDPDNPDLTARVAAVEQARAEGRPTIPFRLGEDKRTNPFLRADVPAVGAAVGMAGAEPAAVFAELRRRKDHFRG